VLKLSLGTMGSEGLPVVVMRQHISQKPACLLLHMPIGVMVSHCIQGRGNATMLSDVIFGSVVHA